ncbi:MMP14-like protein, partial [Mya arenaria]
DYLRKYGYLESSDGRSGSLISEDYFRQAVSKFQKLAVLPVTGELDAETRRTMQLPRCGVKDAQGTGNRARRKRYALHGSKWRKREIAYRISQYSRKVPVDAVQVELQRAFDDYGPVDIEIKFVNGHHGDNTPFDGSGQTLAHAYFPQYGSDAHFDDDEKWTINIADGTKESIHTTTTRAPVFWTTKAADVTILDICRNATIDAITRTDDGITYVFKGEYYYRLSNQGIDTGYPRKIEWDWGAIQGPIDSALTWPNGWTFIFKGSYYWKFHNLSLKYGPKNISEGFDGIPAHIDTAFVWSGNGKTYFVKGNKYWRYYGNKIDYGYPRDLQIWRGLPSNIDAAFQWKKGRTYFFSGDKYYRYNDQIFNVKGSSEFCNIKNSLVDAGGYPRDISTWWLGCPDKSQIVAYDRQKSMQANNRRHGLTYNSESADSEEQWITVDSGVTLHSGARGDGDIQVDQDVHSGANNHFVCENVVYTFKSMQNHITIN